MGEGGELRISFHPRFMKNTHITWHIPHSMKTLEVYSLQIGNLLSFAGTKFIELKFVEFLE